MGNAYTMMGDYKKAIQCYDQALVLNPNSALALYNRGYSKIQLGQVEEGNRDRDQAKILSEQQSSQKQK